jgi:hypothetical protein
MEVGNGRTGSKGKREDAKREREKRRGEGEDGTEG